MLSFGGSQAGSTFGGPFFLGRERLPLSGIAPQDGCIYAVGPLTLAFGSGNSAAFTYTVDTVTQTKQITRQVFKAPGTVCQ